MAFALEKNLDKRTAFLRIMAFYKKKPDRFIVEVLKIALNLYQRVLVRAFFQNRISIWAMGRGVGKSWLAALCLVTYCILNPNTKAGVIAPSFRQSKAVIKDKIVDDFLEKSTFLKNEIKSVSCSVQNAEIVFNNGSWIRAFPIGNGNDGEKIRGARLNLVLVDEYAYVNKEVIDTVIKPMMIVKRDYKVGERKEESVEDSNKMLLTSTMGYRFNHFYQELKKAFETMGSDPNEKIFAFSLTYKMGLQVHLFDETNVNNAKNDMTEEQFEMEYNARAPKLVDGAWINYDDLMKCRNIPVFELSGYDQFKYIMSVDVARQEGQDNTVMMVFRLDWVNDHYEPLLVYICSLNGAKFEVQAKTLREILKKYATIEKIYMDTMTIGLALKDELSKPYFDEVEGKWFPPLLDMNDETAMRNINETNGVPIIYGITAGAAINHEMGYAVKKYTQKHWLHLYSEDTSINEINLTLQEKLAIDETKKMISEVMGMKTKLIGQWVKFYTDDVLKDRWSCLCYGLYGTELKYKEKIEGMNNGIKIVTRKRFTDGQQGRYYNREWN